MFSGIHSYISRAAGSAVLLLFTCCSNQDLEPTIADGMVKSFCATSTDWIPEPDATRALDVDPVTGGLAFSWALGDVLGIYPIGGDQVSFPISDGAGSKEAKFDGGSWALRAAVQYAAYYPFNAANYHIAQTEIPVSLIGQTQDGNNSLRTASSFDFQAAAATTPNSNGSVMLSFQHLCSFMKLKLTVQKPGTYTHVKVTSDNAPFGTKAKYDLTLETPYLMATETSASVEMDLNNITTMSDDELVTIYCLAVPTDLSGSKLSIELTDSNGKIHKSAEDVSGKTMVAGHMYGYAASIAITGTGGTGEDIDPEE